MLRRDKGMKRQRKDGQMKSEKKVQVWKKRTAKWRLSEWRSRGEMMER